MYAHHSIITTGQSGYKTTYGVTRSSWQLFWARLQQLCKIQWCVGVCVCRRVHACMHGFVCAYICVCLCVYDMYLPACLPLMCIHGIGASMWMLVCSGVEVLTKKLFSFSTSPSQCTWFWLLYRHSTWVWLWEWYQGKLGNQEQCPQFSKTHLSSINLHLTISLPFLVFTWKRPIKVQKLQIPLKSLFFFFFFTSACERICIKNTQYWKQICYA